MIELFYFAILAWLAVPVIVMTTFTFKYGYYAECEITLHIGPGALVGVSWEAKRMYWCPCGLIGFEIEILE
jgi:hypothetical protein